jgi:hypothetical protein
MSRILQKFASAEVLQKFAGFQRVCVQTLTTALLPFSEGITVAQSRRAAPEPVSGNTAERELMAVERKLAHDGSSRIQEVLLQGHYPETSSTRTCRFLIVFSLQHF